MIDLQLSKTLRSGTGPMDLQLDIILEPGKFYGLYGRSGAGKTSILRIIAGLMKPDAGIIRVADETWFDAKNRIDLKPQKREAGLIFQDYALFPNMSVEENLRFALRKGEPDQTVHDLIDTMELGDLRHRRPDTLSGGQKQRVAVARALVQRPKLLLLDEPLAALDHEMRSKLQGYILRVHREFKLTSILVSHDPDEMQRMADQVFILEAGKVIKSGRPTELFQAKGPSRGKPVGKVKKVEETSEGLRIHVQTSAGTIQCLLPPDLGSSITPGMWMHLDFLNDSPLK
jgi:molybdate transport system ATP-binding protein